MNNFYWDAICNKRKCNKFIYETWIKNILIFIWDLPFCIFRFKAIAITKALGGNITKVERKRKVFQFFFGQYFISEKCLSCWLFWNSLLKWVVGTGHKPCNHAFCTCSNAKGSPSSSDKKVVYKTWNKGNIFQNCSVFHSLNC